MLHKIRTVLFVLTMLLRLAEPQPSQIKPYRCDTKELIDEIQHLSYFLKRLIRHDRKIYFVLSTRVIFMELLLDNDQLDQDLYSFFDPDKPRNDPKNRTPQLFYYHYLNFSMYEQENQEIEMPEKVPNRFKVFGHIFNARYNITTEYYFVRKGDLRPKLTTQAPTIARSRMVKNYEIYNTSYLLNFDMTKRSNVILAERDQPADATHLYLTKPDAEDQFRNIIYFNRIYVEDSGGEGMDLRIDVFYDQFEFNATYTKGQLAAALIYAYGEEKHRQTYWLSNKPDYLSFVIYMRDVDFGYQKIYVHQPIYFLGFDVNSKIELSVFDFFDHTHELLHSVQFDPEELFDCFTKVTHERQLKGVYHDTASRLFFVFVKRFYLKIDKVDLVLREFFLPQDWYLEKAQRLPEIEAPFFEKIDPQFLGRKWVKAIGATNTVYSSNNRDFFQLTVGGGEELSTGKTSGSGFRSCYTQTLVIEQKYVFCFKQGEYFFLYTLGNELHAYYWNKNRYPIGEIFAKTDLDWADQRVVLIFNYKEDRFVILTQSDLFVFEYKKFTLLAGLTEEEHKIRYLHDVDDKKIKRKRNCMLVYCKTIDTEEPENVATTQVRQLDKTTLALFIVFMVILAVLLIILIFSLSLNHVLSRSNIFNGQYNKYFGQRKSKDSKSKDSKRKPKGKTTFSIKVKK